MAQIRVPEKSNVLALMTRMKERIEKITGLVNVIEISPDAYRLNPDVVSYKTMKGDDLILWLYKNKSERIRVVIKRNQPMEVFDIRVDEICPQKDDEVYSEMEKDVSEYYNSEGDN